MSRNVLMWVYFTCVYNVHVHVHVHTVHCVYMLLSPLYTHVLYSVIHDNRVCVTPEKKCNPVC